jgi:hypothetical protein
MDHERSDQVEPGREGAESAPFMEAPAHPGETDEQTERSWNPAQGDRSFGYGSDVQPSGGTATESPDDDEPMPDRMAETDLAGE